MLSESRWRTRLHGVAALVVAASLALPLSAGAHALLAKSEPARRGVLSKPPAHVRLWFNERLEPAFSFLSVLDAAGNPVTKASARVPAGEPKLLELALPVLAPGSYTVRYQVLSVDGHTVKSSFTFTVKAPATTQQRGPRPDDAASAVGRRAFARGALRGLRSVRQGMPAPDGTAPFPASL